MPAVQTNERIPEKTRLEARSLFMGGMGLPQVARTLGLVTQTVSRWAEREDWKGARTQVMISEGLTTPVNRASAEHAAQLALAALDSAPSLARKRAMHASLKAQRGQTRQTQAAWYQRFMVEALMQLPLIISFLPPSELIARADKIAKLDELARKHLGLDAKEGKGAQTVVNVGVMTGSRPREIEVGAPPDAEEG